MELGIEKIKAMFIFVFGGYDLYESIMEDGKISIMDLPAIIAFLPSIPEMIENAPGALEQFKDLSQEEIAELEIWVKDEFDIPDDQLEAKIEEALSIVSDLGQVGLKIAAFVESV